MDDLKYYLSIKNSLQKSKQFLSPRSTKGSNDSCNNCISNKQDSFRVGFYATRNGEILDLDLEITWYETLPGIYDPIKRSKKFSLDRFHKCEYITLPNGNAKCCYTINGVRRTDSYVKNSADISNDVKYINVDVSKSADNLYFNIGNESDMIKNC